MSANTSRRPAWAPFAVFLLTTGGTYALAQKSTDPNFIDEMTCSNCGHTWATKDASSRAKCPKCGTEFTHVVNPDGTKSSTGASATSENPYKKIAFIVGAVVLVLAATLAVIKLMMGGGKAKKAVKKKKRKRPVRDEEDDEDAG